MTDERNICKASGKIIHTTRNSAKKQGKNLERRGRVSGRCTPYKCNHCDGWHVTTVRGVSLKKPNLFTSGRRR